MNKVFPLIILFSTFLYSQQSDLLKLRQDLNNVKNETPEFSTIETPKKKNTGLAIIYSLILPGMGELYAENYNTGKYFTIAEGALWLSYAGINTYGEWLENRYKSFALSRGEINPAGKDDEYYATISEYFSIEEYNNEQALNRDFESMYNPSEYYWKWNTSSDRRSYRNMWVSSEQAYNSLRFIVGGLVVNRILSAINAVRLVSAYNKRASEQAWNISVSYSPDMMKPGLSLNFYTEL